MLRPFGPGLPSDSIVFRVGIEGNEAREEEGLHRQFAKFGLRSTFAINTNHPEVLGGYYENRALFRIIGKAMESIRIYPVILDVWRTEGLVPVEGVGDFTFPEQYALANERQDQLGLLQVWKFFAGGGGEYYDDKVVFDFILAPDITDRLVNEVESMCQTASVRFTRAQLPRHGQ